MGETVNKVILRGRIESLRELKISPVAKAKRFALATQEVVKNSKGDAIVETQYHSVAAVSDKLSEGYDIIQYGVMVELEGRLKYLHYINAEGVSKIMTEIQATSVKVL